MGLACDVIFNALLFLLRASVLFNHLQSLLAYVVLSMKLFHIPNIKAQGMLIRF